MNVQVDLLIIDRTNGHWPDWAIDFLSTMTDRDPVDVLNDLYAASSKARK